MRYLCNSVRTACLLHDVGNLLSDILESCNPDWVNKNEKQILQTQKKGKKSLAVKYFKGLKLFDGNAQGFRIVNKTTMVRRRIRTYLTCTQLATLVNILQAIISIWQDRRLPSRLAVFKTGNFQIGMGNPNRRHHWTILEPQMTLPIAWVT